MLNITNTLSGKKELLAQSAEALLPTTTDVRGLSAPRVGLYVCGMTVYDHCHLGHARSAIVFDMIRNYLEYKNLDVCYVKNFTDVDDKIIHRAQEENRDWRSLAEVYIASYEDDMKRLNVRPPTLAPKATDHIPEMIALIKELIAKGIAYAVDGDVYFEVDKYSAYGQLSKQNGEALVQGSRIEIDPKKRSPLDFALWKKAKQNEPSWDSPWGDGRPGWHIECSAMAIKYLGSGIDLHGGGLDLIFPHHENEIAQSEAATGVRFAASWVHHGMVTLKHEKMSKSVGNFFTIKEIFERFPVNDDRVIAELIRFFLLSTHYRSAIDFSDEALVAAWAGLDRFYELFTKFSEMGIQEEGTPRQNDPLFTSFQFRLEASMDDDFNTPATLGILHELRGKVNQRLIDPVGALFLFQRFGKLFGLFQVPSKEWRYKPPAQGVAQELTHAVQEQKVQEKIVERETARRDGNWALSDQIRLELKDKGILLEDRPDGTTRVKR